jgi:predicted Ser/Thr protein kinase
MIKLPIKIINVEFFDKGKRSLVYTGNYKNKKVIIKVKNPKSQAIARISNEAKYLKKLNKFKVGPKLICFKKEFLVYEFIEGELYIDLIKTKQKISLTLQILDKCRTLDKLKINKLEFIRPIKHFFVKNNKVKMIDFERCYQTENPKNVTQFCNFLLSNKNFKINKKELIKLSKEYKNKQTDKNFKEIKNLIKLS